MKLLLTVQIDSSLMFDIKVNKLHSASVKLLFSCQHIWERWSLLVMPSTAMQSVRCFHNFPPHMGTSWAILQLVHVSIVFVWAVLIATFRQLLQAVNLSAFAYVSRIISLHVVCAVWLRLVLHRLSEPLAWEEHLTLAVCLLFVGRITSVLGRSASPQLECFSIPNWPWTFFLSLFVFRMTLLIIFTVASALLFDWFLYGGLTGIQKPQSLAQNPWTPCLKIEDLCE